MPFPVMLLQPLVENATIHGQSPDNKSYLQIHFRHSGERIICTILDNGVGIRAKQASNKRLSGKHQSKGLELIMKKIKVLNHLYQLDIQFSVSDRAIDLPPERGTRTCISFRPDLKQ
jgi:sensor histidine kinase YesM